MPRMPEVVSAYYDADGTLVTVYSPAPVRRERQPVKKAGNRTSGRKTRSAPRLGLGSYKGVK